MTESATQPTTSPVALSTQTAKSRIDSKSWA
jgi:hypothetical protein